MYNGRPVNVLLSLQVARKAFAAAVKSRDAYAAELEWTLRQLDEIRAEFAELKAVVLERNKAQDYVAELHRERAIQRARAAERDPNAMLN
jgi:hypothetical protein